MHIALLILFTYFNETHHTTRYLKYCYLLGIKITISIFTFIFMIKYMRHENNQLIVKAATANSMELIIEGSTTWVQMFFNIHFNIFIA